MFKKRKYLDEIKVSRYERCPIEGCHMYFATLKEAALHFAKVSHCKECGFGEIDLLGLTKVYKECFACAFLASAPPSDADYLFH
jgi:hypothetical protein